MTKRKTNTKNKNSSKNANNKKRKNQNKKRVQERQLQPTSSNSVERTTLQPKQTARRHNSGKRCCRSHRGWFSTGVAFLSSMPEVASLRHEQKQKKSAEGRPRSFGPGRDNTAEGPPGKEACGALILSLQSRLAWSEHASGSLISKRQELAESMEAYENAKGGLSKCEQDKQGAPTEEEDARVKREKVEEEVKKTEDEVKPKAEEMLDRLEKLKKKLEDVEIPRAKKLKVCHMSDSATDAANKEISSFEDETRRDALELYTTMLITAGELNDIRHALELDVKACEKKLEQQKAGDSMQAEQKSSTAHAAEPHQAELQPSKANQEEEPSDATKLMSMKQEKEQKEEDTATPEVEPQQKIEEKVEGAPSGAPGCCK